MILLALWIPVAVDILGFYCTGCVFGWPIAVAAYGTGHAVCWALRQGGDL